MTPMNTDEDKSRVSETALSSTPISYRCPSVTSAASSLPVPNAAIVVRVGTRADIGFIDALQKKYSKALGFFPRAQLEGYIDNGWMLIAEMMGQPVGFVASRDRYLKRDELGVIYQMCVSPAAQRSLVAATLVKHVFERSAYGSKLYCCWCAQDLAANRFWEAMGFVAIAFRTGSRTKGAKGSPRVHLFWQKRIRAGDTSTPWWFPSQTSGGSIREDRIVLPMRPGMHWSEAQPTVLPGLNDGAGDSCRVGFNPPLLSKDRASPGAARKSAAALPTAPSPSRVLGVSALRFVPPTPVKAKREPREKVKREKAKHEPQLIAAARELRDRWMEAVNENGGPTATLAKYEVSRMIETSPMRESAMIVQAIEVRPALLIEQAA